MIAILLLLLTYHAEVIVSVSFSIFEEMPELSLVGNVAQASGIRGQVNSSLADKLRFSILSQDQNNFFSIEEMNSDLKTTKPIDRDEICPQEVICELQLEAAVLSSPTFFQVISIRVELVDINDEKPYFLENSTTKSIPENALIGAKISLPAAEDRDSEQYGKKSYSLETTSSVFSLLVEESVPGAERLYLVLEEALDREVISSYLLAVTVTDGTHTGRLIVDVAVLDHNDHPPLFSNDTYSVEVPENTPTGHIIFTASASDRDEAANAEIRYSFSKKTQITHSQTFSIDEITGAVKLDGELDFDNERSRAVELQLVAIDNGQQPLRTETTLHIVTTDVNDNPPRLSLTALTSSGKLELSESAPDGSFFAHVSVFDPDTGDGGKVTCDLYPPTVPIRIKTDVNYRLVTSSPLDREDFSQYDMTFTCTDLGLPQLTSSIDITLKILDENDNAPIFHQTEYLCEMSENNEEDAYIATVLASDADEGSNGQIRYRLEGNFSDYVTIDSVTGQISAERAFDFEKTRQINMTIVAEDLGNVPKNSIAELVLTILNVNDVPPAFTQNKFTFFVSENQEGGAEVGRVLADEEEEGAFGEFLFSFAEKSPGRERFAINPVTGIITTRMVLDREESSSYVMTVTAMDKMDMSLSATTTVSILVADENDNAPVMTFPSAGNDVIHISNRTPLGHVVYRAMARDDDFGENAALRFSVIGGSGQAYFIIDARTGNISTVSSLKSQASQRFALRLQVHDGGMYPRSSEGYLSVIVNKSLSFSSGPPAKTLVTGTNVTIVIAVSVVSSTVVVILVVAIAIVCRGDKHQKRRHHLQAVLISSDKSIDKHLHQINHNAGFDGMNVTRGSDSAADDDDDVPRDVFIKSDKNEAQIPCKENPSFVPVEEDCAASETSSCPSAADSGQWSAEERDSHSVASHPTRAQAQGLHAAGPPPYSHRHQPPVSHRQVIHHDSSHVSTDPPPRPPRIIPPRSTRNTSFSSSNSSWDHDKSASSLPDEKLVLGQGSNQIFVIGHASHV